MNKLGHTAVTAALIAPVGLSVGYITLDWQLGLCTAAGVAGNLILHPDLDQIETNGQGLKKAIFWLYGKAMPHRSLWSHGPAIGTAIRLLYIGLPIFGLLIWLQIDMPPRLVQLLAFTALGLSVADLGHFLADKCKLN